MLEQIQTWNLGYSWNASQGKKTKEYNVQKWSFRVSQVKEKQSKMSVREFPK
jgi:hypothetical protein